MSEAVNLNIPTYKLGEGSWKQITLDVEPDLKAYFVQELHNLISQGKLTIEYSEGNVPSLVFSNGEISDIIETVKKSWETQGCPILNLSYYLHMVMQDACAEILTVQTEEI